LKKQKKRGKRGAETSALGQKWNRKGSGGGGEKTKNSPFGQQKTEDRVSCKHIQEKRERFANSCNIGRKEKLGEKASPKNL